jgi:guanine deaminase
MDRGAPDAVLDAPGGGIDATLGLIDRWHGRGRLGYAVSPRFAITSSPAQMAAAGELIAARPDLHVQTHLSENRAEIAAACALYPDACDYADIYARFGMLGPRSLFGHCVHLSARERAALAESGSVAVFCPTSNLFLGSGLFDLEGTRAAGVRVAVATDIGAGASWGLPATLGAAYAVGQLQGRSLPPAAGFFMATAGNAAALGLGDRVGRIAPGMEADLVALDPRATPAMALRAERAAAVEDLLFLIQTLGDDRAVDQVWVAGRPAKRP